MPRQVLDYKNKIVGYQSTRFRRRLQVRIVKNTRQPDFLIQPIRVNQNQKYRLTISASLPPKQVLVVEASPYLGRNSVGPVINRVELGRHHQGAADSRHHLEFCLPKSCCIDMSFSFKLYPGGQQVSYQVDELAWQVDRSINPLQPVSKIPAIATAVQQTDLSHLKDVLHLEQIQAVLPAELARTASRDQLDWMKLLESNAEHYRQLIFPWLFRFDKELPERDSLVTANLQIDERHQQGASQALDTWLQGGRSQQWESAQFQLWIDENEELAEKLEEELKEELIHTPRSPQGHQLLSTDQLKEQIGNCQAKWDRLTEQYKDLEQLLADQPKVAKETQRVWDQVELLGQVSREFRHKSMELDLIWLQNQRLLSSNHVNRTDDNYSNINNINNDNNNSNNSNNDNDNNDELEHLQELINGYQDRLSVEQIKLAQLLDEKNGELSQMAENSAKVSEHSNHLQQLKEQLLELKREIISLHQQLQSAIQRQQKDTGRHLARLDKWLTCHLRAHLGRNLSLRIS